MYGVRQRSFFAVALTWLVIGCAGTQTTSSQMPQASPQNETCWLQEPCPPFLPSTYLLGVGGGTTPELAENAARADLAKVLKIRIQEEFRSLERSYQGSGNYGMRTLYTATVESDIRTETDENLQGVEIAKRHQAGNFHHALAILERGPALVRVDTRLEELDQEIDRLVKKTSSEDALEALLDLSQAVSLTYQYANLNGKRAVLHPAGRSRSSLYGPEELAHEMDKRLYAIGVSVEVEGDNNGDLANVLGEHLTSHGFQIVPKETSRLILKGAVQYDLSEADSHGFQKLSLKVVLELRDHEPWGGRIYRILNYSAEASSRKKDKALRIAMGSLLTSFMSPNSAETSVGGELLKVLLGDWKEGGGD